MKDYKYVAFISYQRKDEEWAKWLQHQLEHYHLPIDLIENNDTISVNAEKSSGEYFIEPIDRKDIKELRPVFLDETELAGGNLKDEINKALSDSRYLIVICSPNSAKSKWVNQEVQSYIDSDRTSRIIPIIIEGIPYSNNKDTECYVPALCKLRNTDKERLGINAISEKEKASVKLVAQILGVSFDSLWKRYDREKEMERAKAIEEKKAFQRIESRLLSKKAEEYLSDGDLYNSYINVLNALPAKLNDMNDRPYIWEAENILRKILYTDVNFPENYGKQPPVNQWVSSYNGKMTATANGNSGKIRLWKNDNKSLIKELPGYMGKLSTLKFNYNDTHLLISSKSSNSISLISIETGNTCWETQTEMPVYSSFSPDGSLIISLSSKLVISILDSMTGECVESKIIDRPLKLAEIFPMPELSQENRYITCGLGKEYEKEVFQGPLEGYNYYKYREYDLLIWDRFGQTEYWYRDFPVNSLRSAMFISKKGEENISNLSTEEKKHGISSHIEFSEKPKTLQLTAEEVSSYFQSEIRSYHILHRTNCEPDPYFHSNDPIEVKMSSKGTIAAIFSNPKEIAIWNNYKENNYFVLKGDYGHIREIEFSNNGNLLLSVGSDDKVRLWDIEKKECLQIIGTNNNGWDEDDENSLITAKFSNDDKYLILIYRMKYEIWNITEKKYTAHGLHNDPFNINLNIGTDGSIICTELPVKIDPDFDTYCISPNNKLFALISNNILIVYDIAEGKKLSYRECSGTGIGSICFSSDSQYVISTEYSRISVWDIYEEGPVRVIEDKTEKYKDARLCNINNMLYTKSNEKIIIWEHKPLEQLLEYLRKIFIN